MTPSPSRGALSSRLGSSQAHDPQVAIEELRAAIAQPGMQIVILFCSPDYDLDRMGEAIRAAFACPVIGCTSAGQLGAAGYQRGGVVAASLASDELVARPYLISPLSKLHARIAEVAAQAGPRLAHLPAGRRAFGFTLVDGLALVEESLAATLYQSFGDLPMVGGSAGDDLRFERTAVYWDGAFVSDAAVLTIFETSHPFSAFKLQAFRPTDTKLVVTAADTAARRVTEINGFPAADAYAELLGMTVGQLDARVFSAHPLLLRLGNDDYVRSVRQVNADGSLSLFCAIAEGLVLTIGTGLDRLACLERGFRDLTQAVGPPALVIGCDCILRRQDLEYSDLIAPVGRLFAAHRVIGFNTYGEQLNAVHVNQTLVGIALGS